MIKFKNLALDFSRNEVLSFTDFDGQILKDHTNIKCLKSSTFRMSK